jgi:hypothetical protein
MERFLRESSHNLNPLQMERTLFFPKIAQLKRGQRVPCPNVIEWHDWNIV